MHFSNLILISFHYFFPFLFHWECRLCTANALNWFFPNMHSEDRKKIYFKNFISFSKFTFQRWTNNPSQISTFFFSLSLLLSSLRRFFLVGEKKWLFSVMIPFRGDYVNLRRMPEWRETLRLNRLYHSDRFVVFADVVNEMYKPNAKVDVCDVMIHRLLWNF